jgi:hypothetical protein
LRAFAIFTYLSLMRISPKPLLFSLLIFTGAWLPAPPDCGRFHTGRFVQHVKLPEKTIDVFIIRDANSQVEIKPETHDTSWYVVRWTSPCHSIIKLKKSTQHFRPEIEKIRAATSLEVTIISTGSNYYVFDAWKKGVDFHMRDTIWMQR